MAQPTIVAIDDEREFTKTLGQFFGARGYDIRVASDGIEGMALVDRCDPDVVLVDLKMPGMDGDEVLRRIQATHARCRVIVITAYNDGGKTRDRLLAAGAFAHFDKPISSLRDLSDTIQQALTPGAV